MKSSIVAPTPTRRPVFFLPSGRGNGSMERSETRADWRQHDAESDVVGLAARGFLASVRGADAPQMVEEGTAAGCAGDLRGCCLILSSVPGGVGVGKRRLLSTKAQRPFKDVSADFFAPVRARPIGKAPHGAPTQDSAIPIVRAAGFGLLSPGVTALRPAVLHELSCVPARPPLARPWCRQRQPFRSPPSTCRRRIRSQFRRSRRG